MSAQGNRLQSFPPRCQAASRSRGILWVRPTTAITLKLHEDLKRNAPEIIRLMCIPRRDCSRLLS
jgi:hypothetical protein